MTKLLILDKDGTLVKPRSVDRFPQHPQDQELLPNVSETLERYAAEGWTMAIASNQGGVAAGYKTLEDAIEEMKYCSRISGIDHILFCPDFEGNQCYSVARNRMSKDGDYSVLSSKHFKREFQFPDFPGQYRKPNPGMLEILIILNMVDKCLYVGDRPEDEAAAQAAGIPFQWAKDFFGWEEGQ